MRVGKLDQITFQNIYVKIGGENVTVNSVAQVAPKNINTCVISPFDNHHLDFIEKAIISAENGYTAVRQDKTLIVTQPVN